jgi:hypothetical protein
MRKRSWKTNAGAVLIAISGVIVPSADACPVPEATPWIKWIGSILGAGGLALMGIGLGSKIEKAQKQ